MRWLLRLYPRDWRRHYGAEMEALLAEMRPGPRVAIDLVCGAIDARLHPQLPRRRHSLLPWPLVALVILVSPLVTQVVGASFTSGHWKPLLSVQLAVESMLTVVYLAFPLQAVVALALFWSLAAAAGLALRSTMLARFCALIAFRVVADGILMPFVLTLGRQLLPWLALELAIVALWTGFAAIVLRRTRLRWPAVLVIGCALELAAGGTGLSLQSVLLLRAPNVASPLLEPLRISAWAAALTVLTALRRPRRGWDGWPPGEAGVRARPRPGAPPLSATAARLDRPPSDRIASRG